MAKRGRRKRHSFFKIMIYDFSTQLCIPPAFIKHFEGGVPQKCILQNPSRDYYWDVEVKEIANSYYFENGWENFAQENSLKFGDLLTFEYDGNSSFDVIIYGSHACDHYKGTIPGKDNGKTAGRENSEEALNLGRKRKREFSYQENQRSNKRQQKNEVKGAINAPQSTVQNANHELKIPKIEEIDVDASVFPDDLTNRSHKSVPLVKRHHPSPPSPPLSHQPRNASGISCSKGKRIPRKSKRMKISSMTKTKALEKSIIYQPKNPFFKVFMQPSYVTGRATDVNVPKQFADAHFRGNTRDINLQASNGKTWPVKYVTYGVKFIRTRLACGWKDFVMGNDLKVGDVCIFELIKEAPELLLQVVIVRGNQVS